MFDGDSRKHAIKARGAMAMSLDGITKLQNEIPSTPERVELPIHSALRN